MNRPSRTEDDMVHPNWNQNPPFLAPDLTTCEDLNGIANSRMLKKASGGSVAAFGLLEKPGLRADSDSEADGRVCLRLEIVPVQERLRRLTRQFIKSKAWSWTWWIFSVLATSFLLSSTGIVAGNGSAPQASPPTAKGTLAPRVLSKRDECENGGVDPKEYNVPLHVGALLIIMFVSSFACGFPMIARRFPALKIPDAFFFVVRHFGTGVLIATAFVHLLPTAFLSLGDPCLSAFWVTDYPAMPGAIALGGVFFVIVIEMVFSPARHFSHCAPPAAVLRPVGMDTASSAGNRSRTSLDDDIIEPDTRSTTSPIIAMRDRRIEGGANNNNNNLPGDNLARRDSADKAVQISSPLDDANAEIGFSARFLTPEQRLKKEVLQCVLLEIGILFHSVFIGMALSVSVGNDFIVLLIAIAFHQTFEGLALGSRIACIDWAGHPHRPWLMALAYGLTTPIGQAIGLATHSLYNPNSAFGLVLVGTMNAISSGLLVYASLVELLAEDFLSDKSWEILRGRKRVIACIIVFAGAFLMGLVGAWA
ncbi:Plasma membrane zinc ion transporter [Scedosporium apiospermum]|uniref:Plasma membrane zinc ion transporter n=1 Tax=Pseudallescheria apiosperma TaxID=563466 RepID=A0A084G4B5_PSEDA|nr:Plasma membrane zinc ion transporter [Scedosporium apiospermum]KEZ42177.1 Plasma membrane zinc ion transporter [Scedosporium apiospermum]